MTAIPLRITRLTAAYRRFLDDQHAPNFAADVASSYQTTTLISLLRRGDVHHRRASALALGLLGDRRCIEPLGRALSDPDRGVRIASDDSFRGLIHRDAAPVHHQKLLQLMHLSDGGDHAAVISPLLILIDQAPMYAEAHHQLATAFMEVEQINEAELAYRACLWRCRYHYLAWQGLSRCFLISGNTKRAAEALRRCVEIAPDHESARLQWSLIQRRTLDDPR
ncbi:MAG: HEAT repeat domain-containing protein [Planctomycetota bacterium]